MPKRRRQRNLDSGLEEADAQALQTGSESASRPQRSRIEPGSASDDYLDTSNDETSSISDTYERPRKVIRRTFSHVEVHGPAFPQSIYEGFEPTLIPSTEAVALADLKAAHDVKYASTDEQPEYTYFRLNDFNVYLPNRPRHAFELATLDRLQNRRGFDELLFDGVLTVGSEQRFVQGVRFSTMTIDGYGDPDIVSLHDRICIQSRQAETREIWYQLGKPSQEYRRFYEPFVWLAQFTKYFVDYLLEVAHVSLGHFRENFFKWLEARHRDYPSFKTWHGECGQLNDFRTTVTAHVGFLWKECYSIDDEESKLCKQPVWGEVDPFRLKAIPQRKNIEKKTIVTPFAYNCFKGMYFHEDLEERKVLDRAALAATANRKSALGLTPFGSSQPSDASVHTPRSLPDTATGSSIDVRQGDVICVEPDSKSQWKTASTTWYAYVQTVRGNGTGRVLDVIWLYEPRDTTLGTAFYPFQNELFLSDNCSCGKDAVDLRCVIGKADVAWFVKDPSQESGLFARQKFRTVHDEDTYDFVSLQKSDFQCGCKKHTPMFDECRQKYEIGDTVLVRVYNRQLREDALEPNQIVDFKLDNQQVVLRRLQRMSDHNPDARPNQLILTADVFHQPPSQVIRRCHVQFFDEATLAHGLPTPYDRNGAGDFYFIIGRDDGDAVVHHDNPSEFNASSDEDFSKPSMQFPPLEPGLNLAADQPFKKMKGMGIFCGGGNFDRGLEDGGAVTFQYALDWAEGAIHSYRANVDDPERVQFFCGSVNDYLANAMAGSKARCIAPLGEVELIAAGSPCPGFSNMQPHKQSADSLRNASMVASVVSYVDFYCPRYCILENVVSMTWGMGVNKNENVFAQILASLVAMGYQVQQFHMTAWNHGSSQSRPRVFIVASAPGLEPLLPPPHTHANPSHGRLEKRSLGKSSNGKAFGVQRDDYTPFQHVSPARATADLPNIGDAQPQLCPRFPDHRTPSEESAESRARISAIPVRPRGMGLIQAASMGLLSGESLEYYQGLGRVRRAPESKTYSRVYPKRLFPTVTTALQISCGVVGRTLHWDQHRALTVMELRRAQGFLDHEVIIGSTREQTIIIGNSVDRKVALALGLVLRDSWANSTLQTSGRPSSEATFNAISSHGIDDSQTQQEGRNIGHRFTLSQEEKQKVLDDPAHGFRAIRHILSARESGVAQAATFAPDTADGDSIEERREEPNSITQQQLPTRPHSEPLPSATKLIRTYKAAIGER